MASLESLGRASLVQLIEAQAAILHQGVDEDVGAKMGELNDQQLAKLYEEFQERVSNSKERPIRNVSALLVSLARGLLSGRIDAKPGGGGGNLTLSVPSLGTTVPALQVLQQAEALHGLGLGGGGKGRQPWSAPRSFIGKAPQYAKAPGVETGSVEAMLAEYGIKGVDSAAVQKMEELDPDSQAALLSDYAEANATERIQNASKWLYAKARSMLVSMRKAGLGSGAPTVVPANGQELPDLPGVMLDEECVKKMDELEPEEREELIAEFQAESANSDIRNPSSWLFSKSRARIVRRVTGGRALGFHGSSGRPSSNDTLALTLTGDSLKELAELGVDDQAVAKLKELSAQDLQSLLQQFYQLHSSSQINDPSKWLYSKARTIAARVSQEQRSGYSSYQPSAGKGLPKLVAPGASAKTTAATIASALAAVGVRLPPGTLNAVVSAAVGAGAGAAPPARYGAVRPRRSAGGLLGGLDELDSLDLDEKAREKLKELEPDERLDLIEEYNTEAARTSIQNPSAWIFGRARSKVVDRLSGKGGKGGKGGWGDRRYAPY